MPSDDIKERILQAAGELLHSQGSEAVTTRAVAERAGIQAPTIYRIFGDKQGLLEELAEHGFRRHLAGKAAPTHADPVDNLREGWDVHVAFGMANGALYGLMYGAPQAGKSSPAAQRAQQMLQARIHEVARAGRLRVPEQRAVRMLHSAACGTVFTLLAMPEADRDLSLSQANREAALQAITTAQPGKPQSLVQAAIALKAQLEDCQVLSVAERGMLNEWLDRLSAG
jgi:AcrR family transcriptional regulator